MRSWRYFVVWRVSSFIRAVIWFRRNVERRGCGKEAKVDDVEVGFVVLIWWKEGMRLSRRREVRPFR